MTFPATTTTVPGGSRTGLAWMVTGGVGMAVGERAILDLAWRYTDLGKVRTGRGPGRVVWRDGSREPLPLDLAPTEARLKGHGIRCRCATGSEDRTGRRLHGCRDTTLAEPVCRLSRPAPQRATHSEADGLVENGSACMNKSELAERLAGRTGMSKAAAKDAVDGVFETIGEALANGDEARILGFGTFGTRDRPARTARNPRTGETLSVAASAVPVFKAGKTLRDAVGSGAA